MFRTHDNFIATRLRLLVGETREIVYTAMSAIPMQSLSENLVSERFTKL